MGRRGGFEGFIRAAARAAAAAERQRNREIRAAATLARRADAEARRAYNQSVRDQRAAAKEAKQQYLESRAQEAADLNSEIDERVAELKAILTSTLTKDDAIDFDSLRIKVNVPAFHLPPELLPTPKPAFAEPPQPSWLLRLIPGSADRHQKLRAQALATHEASLRTYEELEASKREKAAKHRAAHDKLVALRAAEAAARDAEVDGLRDRYLAKESDAVLTYCDMVLERSEYPDGGFPQSFRMAFTPESYELVVEYELPEPAVVPEVLEYRYVKSKDDIESKPRKQSEVKELYQDVIASVALRTLHELFEADRADALQSVVFTGVRDTHDPATGVPVRIPVVSVRATKREFLAINLERIEKLACLRQLGAQVARRPEELQAVKPVIEFDMVDRRFVPSGDALAGLESRPNLLQMTPTEFEVLVSNLFTRMGLDTKLTRASRDGGVDAVAFDTRPVVGGKVVIQAKRYKDTVGVSAVRDLYGTMQHEGANKGVLVTTSGYGPDAFQFAKDKPIELVDGGGLLFLLREHAGVSARIVH